MVRGIIHFYEKRKINVDQNKYGYTVITVL